MSKENEILSAEELKNHEAVQELPEEELEKVAGGAFPTSVNDQVTDSIT